MIVPVGMMKRTIPSEAATAQPEEPSVVVTSSGESVALYSSMNSSLASGDVSGGAAGELLRTEARAFRRVRFVAPPLDAPATAPAPPLQGDEPAGVAGAAGTDRPGPRRRNSEMMSWP